MPRARAASFCCPRAVAVSKADANLYRAAAVEKEANRGREIARRSLYTVQSNDFHNLQAGPEDGESDTDVSETACLDDRMAADLALCSRMPAPGTSVPTSRRDSRMKPLPGVPTRRASLPGMVRDDVHQSFKTEHEQSCDPKRHCKARQREKMEDDLRQAQLCCDDDRRRFEEEKASYVREANLLYEEERRKLAAEKAALLKELEDEKLRILKDSERKLEEERQRILQEAQEAQSKLASELSINEHARKIPRKSRKLSTGRCDKKNQLRGRDEMNQSKQVQVLSDEHKRLEAECRQLAQEAERCKQELLAENDQLSQKLESTRKTYNDRIQDERARLAAEMEEKQNVIEEKRKQDHLREMEEAKVAKQNMLDEAKRVAEMHMEKLKEERQAFLEQRKAFEEEKAQFLEEKKRLEAEFRRLKEAVKSEQQTLAESVKRREAEEKKLVDVLKQQKAFQTVASLATVDHSASVDPSLTDIKERAMAKAAAISRHIGSVALRLLFDDISGKLNPADSSLFQKQLASGELLDVESTVICTPEPECFGLRGGKPYYKPTGWIRCGLSNLPKDCDDWCIAYHGTTDCNALRILLHGLKRPGEAGVRVSHGQMHSETGASIYVSPSIEYAAFPCYSQIFKLGEEHWAQLVLECCVRPGSFKQAPGTLSSNKHWPSDVSIDDNFKGLGDLEWLLERNDDVVVSALMIREFGQKADPSIYGPLVTRVKSPEYLWTEMRVEQARASKH